jgi:hypothetical protein
MERHERFGFSLEDVATQFRQLLASLSETAVLHIGDTFRAVHRVTPRWRDLIDAPDGLVVVTIAGDDFRTIRRLQPDAQMPVIRVGS